MLKQNENNLFRDRQETVRCLWFLWCDDLVCYWLHHNKHSRHILGVHANMITAVMSDSTSVATAACFRVGRPNRKEVISSFSF